MIELILAQIKQYAYLIYAGTIIAALSGAVYYVHHKGYEEGLAVGEAKIATYQAIQNEEIKNAEQIKLAKESEDVKNTEIVISAYNDRVLDLMRNVKVVSGSCSVQVATGNQPASSVPSTTNTPSRVNATFETVKTVEINTLDALLDTAQCEKLQEWVRTELK